MQKARKDMTKRHRHTFAPSLLARRALEERLTNYAAERVGMGFRQARGWAEGVAPLRIITLLASALLLFSSPASADVAGYKSGNDLLGWCENESIACLTYIAGVSDTHSVISGVSPAAKGFCSPEHVELGQLRRIVMKWLQGHPKNVHEQAAGLVLGALTDAFPCREKK